MGHKDADPFLNPVDWKNMNLLDYPKVVKTPMDLGSVKQKLERGDYSSAKEFRHDTTLVWTNCMTYNADGSDYYLIAANLKKVFEEKYAKMIREDEEPKDPARPPTLVDKKMCCQNIYNISAEDLGKVVQILDQRCEVSGRACASGAVVCVVCVCDVCVTWPGARAPTTTICYSTERGAVLRGRSLTGDASTIFLHFDLRGSRAPRPARLLCGPALAAPPHASRARFTPPFLPAAAVVHQEDRPRGH